MSCFGLRTFCVCVVCSGQTGRTHGFRVLVCHVWWSVPFNAYGVSLFVPSKLIHSALLHRAAFFASHVDRQSHVVYASRALIAFFFSFTIGWPLGVRRARSLAWSCTEPMRSARGIRGEEERVDEGASQSPRPACHQLRPGLDTLPKLRRRRPFVGCWSICTTRKQHSIAYFMAPQGWHRWHMISTQQVVPPEGFTSASIGDESVMKPKTTGI